jgi:hypothetical protein
MIALTVLLFIVTSGLLYYRWVTMVEPTCVLIVETAPSLRGAEVQVDGLTLPKPHKVIIGSGERFALPFYLEPGEYSVQVTMAGNTLYDRKVVLTRSAPGLRLDLLALKPLVTTSAPATAPVFTP